MTTTTIIQQDMVLKEIQDYLNNNRILEMNKVIPHIRNVFSRSSVNINDEGIKRIINQLIESRNIIEGSKLTKDRILRNENRKVIYYLINKQPGIIFYHIMKDLKLSSRTVAWHLEILCKFGCIKKVKINTHEIYFNSKVNKSWYNPLYLLSNKKIKNLISYMINMDKSGVSKTKISRDLGIDYRTVSNYLSSLEDAGLLLIKEKLNKHKIYSLSGKCLTCLEQFY